MLFHEELFTRSQCACCQQEISGLGIECEECQSPNGAFRICCECFTLGSEIGQHKADHKYRFFDSGSLVLSLKLNQRSASISIPTPPDPNNPQLAKWSAREEIRLLDAIEQYGFGNWQDISKHIETKTPAEAKAEYVNRYVTGTLGELTWSTGIPTEVTRNICITQIQKPVDHTIPCDDGPLSPSLTQRLAPLEIGTDEMMQLGYMPNRDDYEKEYDNEAEKLVSQLSFTPEDEELDIGLKLTLVDIYAKRLRERGRRKRMIRDYQLVSKFFKKEKTRNNVNPVEGQTAREIFKGQFAAVEKNLREILQPYCQFHNSREFDNLVRNLVKAREMRYRLLELYKYRKSGIRRLEDCSEFERLKGTANTIKGKRPLDTITESENQEGRSGTKKAKLLAEKMAAPLLVRQLQQALPPDSPKAKSITPSNVGNDVNAGASPSAVQSLTQQLYFKDDSSLKNFMELSESGRVLFPQDLQEEPKTVELLAQNQASENSFLLKEKLRDSGDRFIADIIPSADLLTDKEFQLCARTNLFPAQYLTVKTALLLSRKPKIDNQHQQNIDTRDVSRPPNVQGMDWEHVLTFFKTNFC